MSKVVLITGASSGLGKATASHLADLGYVVYGTCRNPNQNETPPNYKLISLDLNQPTSIQSAVEELLGEEGRIDVLINNAGSGIIGPMEELEIDALRANFETNCYGPLLLMQKVLPVMRKQKEGFVVSITSIGCAMGLPFRGAYSASKGALSLLTESLRMEVKPFGINMCTVAPGDFVSDIASRRYYAPQKKQSPYEAIYKRNLATIDAHVSSGIQPEVIAHKIARILPQKNPKVHYRVGAPLQKFSVVLKGILPSRLFEKLLLLFFKN
ncbi:MAG: SDR family oxidoreductase [Flavobacteriaceae bacterium]|nr:SDR family oxidoreductase [Flavobacteriaceae bacterium]MDG1921255.1 SDR family oxidoreductase [Flavobacteriaceae bacterium]